MGGERCELCILIKDLGKLVDETAKQIKKLEPVIAFERMKKEYGKLRKTHHVCAGCGLCFGGHHIAFPAKIVPKVGGVCQWCAAEINKNGLTAFKKRLKTEKKEAKNGDE